MTVSIELEVQSRMRRDLYFWIFLTWELFFSERVIDFDGLDKLIELELDRELSHRSM